MAGCFVVGREQDAAGSTSVAPCTRASNLQVLDGPELFEPIERDSIKDWAKADKLYSCSVRQDVPWEIERGRRKEEAKEEWSGGVGRLLGAVNVRLRAHAEMQPNKHICMHKNTHVGCLYQT